MSIQPEFRPLVHEATRACRERFGDRLAAAYLSGSVAVGEAWPGASDLDWFTFLDDAPSAADQAWATATVGELEESHPVAADVHLNVLPAARLRDEPHWRFILRYNSRRMLGRDLIADLERDGVATMQPSPELARSRLPFVRQCLASALVGECPASLAEIPAEPHLASRKLARNFVIVEGAYLLMARRAFTSFRQDDVLRGLDETSSCWRALLRQTAEVLADPYRAGIPPEPLMASIEPFVRAAMEEIDSAAASSSSDFGPSTSSGPTL